jgi:hypothetical protein
MGRAMNCKITQYGLSAKAGGWDTYGDSSTDKFEGDHGNMLQNGISCALTASAVAGLLRPDGSPILHGDYLQIVFENGFTYIRRWDDTAPESDPRLDMFNAYAFDKQMDAAGQFADARVIVFESSAQPS